MVHLLKLIKVSSLYYGSHLVFYSSSCPQMHGHTVKHNSFTKAVKICAQPTPPSLSLTLEPLAVIDLFIVFILLPYDTLECHIVGLIHYVTFPNWRFHLAICIKFSPCLLLLNNIQLYG